jgi:transposase-like protein
MPKKRSRVFSRAFKLAAVRRMIAGEDVSALSRELRVLRKDLYYWRTRFRAGGPEALRGKGRPKKTEVERLRPNEPSGEVEKAHERIAELERKIGQQQVDLDFFRQALRRVGEARRPSAKPGALRSTRSSKR